jgi:lipoprotein-anchoring transpeptidase ErfK/SrfK
VRRTAVLLAAGALVLLAGCNGDKDHAGGRATATGTSAADAPPATVRLSLADGSTGVSPATPLQISVTGGSLDRVTVLDGGGRPVQGTVGDVPAGDATPSTGSARSGSPSSSPASGANHAEGQVWTPAQPLAYGTKYTLTATATNPAHKKATASATFTTVTPRSQTTPSIGPLDGTTVGVGMPIRVFLDHPVADENRADVERHLKVTTSVPTDGVWHWMSDTEVHFRPSTYWPANSDVRLDADLYGVDLGDGVWGRKNRTVSFTVGDKHVSVADAAAHTLQVYNGDRLVQTFPMSAGSNANPTRNGDHVVLQSYRNITMDSSTFGLAVDAPGGYRSDVEYAVRISNNGEFVHAAPWSVGDQGHSNVSHGCINLSTQNAAWFFGWAQPGDVVTVANSVGPMLSSADGDIYDWAIPWDQWKAGSALK